MHHDRKSPGLFIFRGLLPSDQRPHKLGNFTKDEYYRMFVTAGNRIMFDDTNTEISISDKNLRRYFARITGGTDESKRLYRPN